MGCAGYRGTVKIWIQGARPRTLPAAIVPVAIGAALCIGRGGAVWWRGVLALLVSLLLQIGVNYANDYSDGIRGTDEVRVGPVRLVGSGAVPARLVKIAAFSVFGTAAVLGLILALVTSLWVLAVGAAALLAGWFYTGGKNPYGYMGLGEVFVFVFFGLVATLGTSFVVIEELPAMSWLQGCATGCLACALLVINNLRDIPTDSKVGKRTLAVRLGEHNTRLLYTTLIFLGLMLGAIGALENIWLLMVLVALIPAVAAVRLVSAGAAGKELIAVLGATGRLQLLFGILTTVAFVLGG